MTAKPPAQTAHPASSHPGHPHRPRGRHLDNNRATGGSCASPFAGRWLTVLAAVAWTLRGAVDAGAAATVTTLPSIAVSADSFGGASVALGDIVLAEGKKADIGNGTIILNAPSGFHFDTSAAATVSVVNAGGATLAISGSPASPALTTLSVTTSGSGSGGPGSRATITWSGIKVRATSGSLPAAGTILRTGTASITGDPTNFGVLTEVAGSVTRLVFMTPARTSATGVASAAITVQRRDQFGNANTAEVTRTVTLSSDTPGTATFNPAGPVKISNGVSAVSFTYKDTRAGWPTVVAASVAPSFITPAVQQETVTGGSTVVTWDGGGADDSWSANTNWIGDAGPGPGSVLHFAGTTRLTPVNDFAPGSGFASIYFDSDAGAFALGGNSVTLGVLIENNSPASQVINLPITVNTGVNLAIRTILGSGDLTLAGVISGGGGLQKQVWGGGVPTAYLGSSNTYSGRTTILAGNLSISSIKPMGSPVPSSLGMPGPGNGTIRMGDVVPAALIYTGTGDETDRGIELAGTTGSASPTLTQNGTGLLKFTGPFTVSEDSFHTLTLNGTGVGEIAGTIPDAATAVTKLAKEGSGTWTLSGTNAFTGATAIREGTLILSSSGSIAPSSSVIILAGAAFDVSPKASPYVWGSGASLTASGHGTGLGSTAAALQGASGGTVDMGTRPITLIFAPAAFDGDTAHPSLYVTGGTLSLGGNAFTVENNSGTALGAGTYRLIEQAVGSVTTFGTHTVTVIGDGMVSGATASIVVTGAYVNLEVAATRTTPVVVTPPVATDITYGDALSASILGGGTSSVAGAFAFTYPDTVPPAGTHDESVTFTPADTGSYESVVFNVSVTVKKATPVIVTPPVAAPILFGQSLLASMLSGATSSVAGAFAFMNPDIVPPMGAANQSVTFAPSDTDNYESIEFEVSVTALAAPPITRIHAETGSTLVEWAGSTVWHYTVECAPSLAPPAPWSTLAGYSDIPGLDGLMQATDTNIVGDVIRFYRLRIR